MSQPRRPSSTAGGDSSRSWIMCGGHLQRGVGSLVREHPCGGGPDPYYLKGGKMLRPEKWNACFDTEGKATGFHKALKFIVLGGMDPSIRAEVWEFLLGCYSLSSTTEYRRKLRAARREKYQCLVKQCKSMHPSIGTGELAYAVGSKLMDVRTTSKETDCREEVSTSQRVVNSCLSDSGDYSDMGEPRYDSETFMEYPSLPAANSFSKASGDVNGIDESHCSFPVLEDRLRQRDERMHSFQINNNIDLIIESNPSDLFRASNSDSAIFHSDAFKQDRWLDDTTGYNSEIVVDSLKISDAPEADFVHVTNSDSPVSNKDRVAEWLWTLHRIVVDVVRTDSHLDFYTESRNMARMSDILAVYAWVDPSTGYCQGMSDLLSPFVVLYEDDADAFWCFEMLLRRMRENFQIEGPTRVMKQLESLWKIVELSDTELFEHLSAIGAESLHFAFRMLLVLFRRELSFEESLSMWEMMWAADFNEDAIRNLEENCLELLVVDAKNDLSCEVKDEHQVNKFTRRKSKSRRFYRRNGEMRRSCNHGVKSSTQNPLCGLSGATIWARHQQTHHLSTNILTKNGDNELPIFCVAAILIINRHKIIRGTHSIDDTIKMFNDNILKINVKRCVRMAVKLRKKYLHKSLKGGLE
ncbi:hypothetical protein ACQ4PT_007208 [Festuca glaucescens]